MAEAADGKTLANRHLLTRAMLLTAAISPRPQPRPALSGRCGPTRCAAVRKLAGVVLCGVLSLSNAIAATQEPVFKTQFVVRDGYVALDPAASTLDLGTQAAAFVDECGLAPEAVRSELMAHVERLLHARGKLLDQLAIPPVADPSDAEAIARRAAVESGLRDLAKTDARTTELYTLSASWRDAEARVTAWMDAHAAAQPAVTLGRRSLKDAYEPFFDEPKLADGPLAPAADLFDVLDPNVARDGRAVFRLLPPFSRVQAKIRPDKNPQEWSRHRSRLAQDLLEPLACKLWYRDRIVERAKDYFEMRGIAARGYRAPRDARDEGADAAPPGDSVGIAAERPDFERKDFGGRVLLSPDPLVENVYVELAASQWAALRRVLYLLLPSRDFRRVVAAPATYLCRMDAVWKPVVDPATGRPQVVRLALSSGDGATLALANAYLTRRAFAERLQRLDTMGFGARMDLATSDEKARRKYISLLVEPAADAAPMPAATEAGPELPACVPAGGAAPIAPQSQEAPAPLSTREHPDIVQPERVERKTARRDARSGQRVAERAQRHRLDLGVEHDAGKPPRYSLGFARTGLGNDDTFSVQIGQQRQSSGDVQYSRDFVGFGTLDRRVQMSVRAFSDFDPNRASVAAGADERRSGAEIRATVDLWRDRRGSWGQVGLGASRSDIELAHAAGNPAKTRIRLADLALTLVKAWDGTPSSRRIEVGASVARGRVSELSDAFTRYGLDLSHHQFVGAFTRVDLRAHAQRIAGAAPRTEWPVFGGEDSVRGYPADAAVARSTWVLQSEYWMPLPWPARGPDGMATLLRRSVALAVFADVGGLSRSAGSLTGHKLGVGAGVRLSLKDGLTLRVDWARAVGESAEVGRSGRLYLTVSSARTL
jgi:hypothetical protein